MADIRFLIFILPIVAVYGIPEKHVEISVKAAKIHPLNSYRSPRASIGVVKGTHSCGGSGKLLQWRYETCKESDTLCHVPADGMTRRAEVDFIPSKDIAALGLRLKVKSEDGSINEEYNFRGPILNATVRKGQPYTITNGGGVTSQLKGKYATFQYILFDESNDEIEICAEADLQYV